MWIVFIALVYSSLLIKPIQSRCNDTYRQPPEFIDRHNSYSLWPGLISPHSLKYGQSLYGMEQAIRKIWYHQHPSDCTRVKYLISEGWFQEFGLELHGHGVGLGLALESNRIFLQEDGWTWRYRNNHCKDQNLENWECYFEPFSKCTVKDAIVSHLKVQKLHSHNNNNHHINHQNHSHHTSGNTDTVVWTIAEDKLLRDAVIKYGKKGKWAEIGHTVGTKTDASCHSRWYTHLQLIVEKDANLAKEEIKSLIYDDVNIHDYRSKHHGVISLNRVTDIKIINGKVEFDIKYTHLSDQILVVSNEVIIKSRTFVPSEMVTSILKQCSDPAYYYYWWRSISMTYLIRPNLRTLDFIDSHRDSTVRESQGKCISTFIRHTKNAPVSKEMVSLSSYTDVALKLFNDPSVFPPSEYSNQYDNNNALSTTATATTTTTAAASNSHSKQSLQSSSSSSSSSSKNIFYFASEDHDNFAEAEEWGKKHNIIVKHSNLSTILLHPSHYHHPLEFELNLPENHELEYFSYILHIYEILSCDVVICMLSSHFCRIIDELRMTVGGNSVNWNADISLQTCAQPPCIRKYGLANHEDNSVYDPENVIW